MNLGIAAGEQFAGRIIDIYFGQQAPSGKEKNWIRTVSGRG